MKFYTWSNPADVVLPLNVATVETDDVEILFIKY